MPTGPCPDLCSAWAEETDLPTACQDLDADKTQQALDAASWALFMRSRQQWPGSCRDTVRPTTCCTWGCARRCCGTPPTLELGITPITSIVQVLVDGDEVASSAYQIRDFQWLDRIDGEPWPTCTDLTKNPASDERTFEVTFTYGTPPPVMGKMAAAELAAELLKALCNISGCQLPTRIQSITREGVSAVYIDPFFQKGDFGLPLCDMFLNAVNPDRVQSNMVIASPDMPKTRLHRIT